MDRKKIKQFETKTFFGPDSIFVIKNAIMKGPSLIFGSIRAITAGQTLSYETFTLREIALGFPFNREATKHEMRWVGAGKEYFKFIIEMGSTLAEIRFLRTLFCFCTKIALPSFRV